METTGKKVYQIALFICAIIMGLLMIGIDVNAKKVNKYEDLLSQKEEYYQMGNQLENYILDVVFETDLFDDITKEEQEYLDYLYDEEKEIGLYYIELIRLMGKYYGDKE